MKASVENEIKLAVSSAAKARSLLRGQEFRVVAPRVFERNLVLDDDGGSLRAKGMLLRLRSAGSAVTCTFKGTGTAGKHKSRPETEFGVSDLQAGLVVFASLGYRERFRYEKYRTELAREGTRGVAMIDETPIGVFMELEGPARWIDRTAKALGFSEDAYITASYGQLYAAWCEAYGIQPTGMSFESKSHPYRSRR